MSADDLRRDTIYLERAVDLAREHMRLSLGGPFGAVIVKDDRILAEGANQVTSHNDPTAHAEVVAIRRACAEIADFSLKGATIYASCEPCPMCLASIYWARIDRIVYANSRSEAAEIGFDDAFLYEEVSKEVSDRSLPMFRIALPSARDVFSEWMTKEDRIPY
jgi:guanine deaminase